MLRELNELGLHFQLSPLGYSEVNAHWQIDLIGKGASISPLVDAKGKLGQKILGPDLRRNADEPLLIDDTGEYLFGAGERGPKRQKLYLKLLENCIAATDDEGAKRVRDYILSCSLEEIDRQIAEKFPPKTQRDGTLEKREPFWWSRDRFIFTQNGERITHRPVLQQWWSDYYAAQQDTQKAICVLTGRETLTLGRKLPAMVKGVSGTQPSGAAISSFDKAAYQSHGWEGNANAPISFEVAVRVLKVLDELLKDDLHHYRLGGQTFLFWGDAKGEGIDPDFWKDPAAAAARNLFKAPDKPSELPSDRALSRHFYLAALKGNQGRIALSNWDERSPEEIKANVKRFVSCQEIVPGEPSKPIWVLRNCAFRDPNKEHTDKITTALFRAVLFGAPLPDEYAIRVINRICQEQDVTSLDRIKALSFYLMTTMNQLPTPPATGQKISPDQFAYIFGRIAYLMHLAQMASQGLKREETNVSRSLRTLSTTPAIVFPRLYYGCITNHLENRDGSPYLQMIKGWLDDEFTSLGDFEPSTDLPQNFTTRQQACFFFGFGKRRAEESLRIKEKKEQKSAKN